MATAVKVLTCCYRDSHLLPLSALIFAEGVLTSCWGPGISQHCWCCEPRHLLSYSEQRWLSTANRNQAQKKQPYIELLCTSICDVLTTACGREMLTSNFYWFLPYRYGAQLHLKSHLSPLLFLSQKPVLPPAAPLLCPRATRAIWKSLGRPRGLPRCTCGPSPSLLTPPTALHPLSRL